MSDGGAAMAYVGFALIVAGAVVLIIWRGIAWYTYGLHKKDL